MKDCTSRSYLLRVIRMWSVRKYRKNIWYFLWEMRVVVRLACCQLEPHSPGTQSESKWCSRVLLCLVFTWNPDCLFQRMITCFCWPIIERSWLCYAMAWCIIRVSFLSPPLLTRTMGVPTSHMADFMIDHNKYTTTELRADVGLWKDIR